MMFLTLNGVLKALLVVVGGALTLGSTKSVGPAAAQTEDARTVVAATNAAATVELPPAPPAVLPAAVSTPPAALAIASDPLAAIEIRVLPPQPAAAVERPASTVARAAQLRSVAMLNRPRRNGGQKRRLASRRPQSARDGLLRAAASKPRPKSARRRA